METILIWWQICIVCIFYEFVGLFVAFNSELEAINIYNFALSLGHKRWKQEWHFKAVQAMDFYDVWEPFVSTLCSGLSSRAYATVAHAIIEEWGSWILWFLADFGMPFSWLGISWPFYAAGIVTELWSPFESFFGYYFVEGNMKPYCGLFYDVK